jgi:hypothetical protein
VKVLVFDISGSTGWAEFDSKNPGQPVAYGIITIDKAAKKFDHHPWGYVQAAVQLANRLVLKVHERGPDVIVVEETNGARARFTQKFLEYCHFAFLWQLNRSLRAYVERPEVVYVNTSDWRRKMDVRLTDDDKRQNARLSRNKRKAKEQGTKLDKKALGIRGRVTIKHVAIRRANDLFGLGLIAKDDDIADALLIGSAYLRGVEPCNGSD